MRLEQLSEKLRSTPLFGHISQPLMMSMLQECPLEYARAGDVIHETDGQHEEHIVLVDGEIKAWSRVQATEDESKDRSCTLRSKASDSGVEVLTSAARNLRVQALTGVQYLRLDADRIDELLSWTQFSDAKTHNKKSGHLWGLIRRVGVFQHLPLENVQRAFERMESRSVAAGDTVITEGDEGKEYFLIEEGKVEVIRTDPFTGESTVVDHMEGGDAFGEEALLQQGYRNATIRMLTPGRFQVLKKEDFDDLVKPSMLTEVSAPEAYDLLQEGKVRLLDCRYDMEYEENRIPGAGLIQLHKLRFETHKLDPGTRYIVYCRSGRRSKAAAFLLTERKFQARSLAGGIKDWPYQIDDAPITL